MRATNCLSLILLLVFVSGCNANGDVTPNSQSTNTPSKNASISQSSEISIVLSSELSNSSEFPPSDWPKKNIITFEEDDGKIFYQEGIFASRFWTKEGIDFLGQPNEVPTKNNPAVPDKETALAIATAIFKVQKAIDWDTKNMADDGVFFDTRDELWIVGFSERPIADYAQGQITIVIRKDNAQVLAIWAEAG